jgi:mannosyltransferase
LRSPRLLALVVGAITVVGLAVRLVSFGDSLFGDETSTYFIVTGHSLSRVVDLLQGNSVDLNPPLSFALAWATAKLGDPAQTARLVSLVAGTAAIPLTYLLGCWTVGRPAGLVGAALMALSPFLIFYGTEARSYGLVLLLVLLSTLALLRALQTRRFAWWAGYAACSCAALYTHYPPVFVLAAQFAWAFWAWPRARRALIAANAAAAVAYLPWLPSLIDNTHSQGAKTIGILEPFGLHAIRIDLGRWAVGHPYIPLATVPGRLAVTMLVAGLAAGTIGAALSIRRAGAGARLPRPSPGAVLVLLLCLATPVGAALISAFGDSIWDARNLTPSWPGLALAAGAVVTGARGMWRIAAISLVVGSFTIGAAKMLRVATHRPDYKAAASFIDRAGPPAAPLVEVPAPSPGPLTPLGDIALNRYGQSTAAHRPVLRLGAPPLDALLHARPYAPVAATPPDVVARRAAALARGGTLFLAAPGSAPLAALRRGAVTAEGAGLGPALGAGPPLAFATAALNPLHAFLAALPSRFHHVETKTFRGFLPVSVYVFRAA